MIPDPEVPSPPVLSVTPVLLCLCLHTYLETAVVVRRPQFLLLLATSRHLKPAPA